MILSVTEPILLVTKGNYWFIRTATICIGNIYSVFFYWTLDPENKSNSRLQVFKSHKPTGRKQIQITNYNRWKRINYKRKRKEKIKPTSRLYFLQF